MVDNYRYLKQPSGLMRMIDKMRNRLAPWLPLPYRLPWGGWILLFKNEFADAILGGFYNEQDELNLLCCLLKPGMVFFDLGANQGIYSIVASRLVGKDGQVYAFEPVPSEYWKLRANCVFNLARNIHVERVAVSGTVGTDFIYAVVPAKGSYSSMRPPADDVKLPVKKIEILTTTLDDYIVQHQIHHIDVLKMDVEGGERDVLAGGQSVFSSIGIRPIVQCEFSDRRSAPWGYTARELAEQLIAYEYVLFEPIYSGIKFHALQDRYDYKDLVAIPKEKVGIVESLVS